MNESIIAIITARGGSKRIPRKNIKLFCGKPIMAYSIEAAVDSGVFDEIMVSTDDDEIADIARKFGANVPFMRSERTSSDFASTEDVIEEVIKEYDKRGIGFDRVCCIYPTAPFISGERLRECYKVFKSGEADSLIPVVKFSYPPQRAFVISEENTLVFDQPQYRDARSQDLKPLFHDVGQFYYMNTASFLKYGTFLDGKIIPYELSEMEVQDIDNETDWKMAELKYSMLGGEPLR